MDTLLKWISDNIGISILISALIGPLIVGSILDLWLRPRVEAKKNQLIFINNLKEESISVVRTIIAGLTFVYKYDKFVQGDGAIKSRSRVLTLQLTHDYEKLKDLNISISKLSPYFKFDRDFIETTVRDLAVISGNIMRIKDTVEEKNFKLFNGVNKQTLKAHIKELESLQNELIAKTSKMKR
jgi:hypothetical protein